MFDMRVDLLKARYLGDESFEASVDCSADDVSEEDAGQVDEHDHDDETGKVQVPVVVPELAEVLGSDFSAECGI